MNCTKRFHGVVCVNQAASEPVSEGSLDQLIAYSHENGSAEVSVTMCMWHHKVMRTLWSDLEAYKAGIAYTHIYMYI